nr:hypothetical protein [Pseudomonadota bacterium]
MREKDRELARRRRRRKKRLKLRAKGLLAAGAEQTAKVEAKKKSVAKVAKKEP